MYRATLLLALFFGSFGGGCTHHEKEPPKPHWHPLLDGFVERNTGPSIYLVSDLEEYHRKFVPTVFNKTPPDFSRRVLVVVSLGNRAAESFYFPTELSISKDDATLRIAVESFGSLSMPLYQTWYCVVVPRTPRLRLIVMGLPDNPEVSPPAAVVWKAGSVEIAWSLP